MAIISTYQQLSEIIQTQHYNGMAPAEAEVTQPHIAQRIAVKVAKMAKISAFENGNYGDTAYANDQFVSVFTGLTLQTDVTGAKYVTMPATPVGLPKNTEIVAVNFTGSPNMQVIPCLQKDTFMENLLPAMPSFIVLYKVENGRIVFINLPAIINSTVIVRMIGTISGPDLMSSTLNIPKDWEDVITNEILQELAQEYNVKPQKKEANSAA